MTSAAPQKQSPQEYRFRFYLVLSVFALGFCALLIRAAYIQVIDMEFLREQGDSRTLRTHAIKTYRGIITDRHGVDLAISIPVDSLWLDPQTIINEPNLIGSPAWFQLAHLVGMSELELRQWVQERSNRRFVYLQRHVSPEVANYVRRLSLPGVNLHQESKRYYPTAEVSAQWVGFTGIDDNGLEGVEKSFDAWLQHTTGKEEVIKDRNGRVVAKKGLAQAPQPGKDLVLSMDYRIQNIAYRELKQAVVKFGAVTGTIVMLDIQTGEILAMASQPSYNPNRIIERVPAKIKNRAITDVFEPGSTLKPFTIVSALESGTLSIDSKINTHPGLMRVGGIWVRDDRNHGVLDVAGILKKSSNVGMAKIALEMDTETLLSGIFAAGFGLDSGAGFPGESAGIISHRTHLSDVEKSTFSYGYGISVTALQLARAYMVLGSGGMQKPISLVKVDGEVPGERVISEQTAKQVIAMLEQVVSEKGTGKRAELSGYRVAGKTGTARKAIAGGYGNEYVAFFAGLAPVENPRLAAAIMINNPSGDYYYGGEVAAPVFAEIMRLALRLINAKPDKIARRKPAADADKKVSGV